MEIESLNQKALLSSHVLVHMGLYYQPANTQVRRVFRHLLWLLQWKRDFLPSFSDETASCRHVWLTTHPWVQTLGSHAMDNATYIAAAMPSVSNHNVMCNTVAPWILWKFVAYPCGSAVDRTVGQDVGKNEKSIEEIFACWKSKPWPWCNILPVLPIFPYEAVVMTGHSCSNLFHTVPQPWREYR